MTDKETELTTKFLDKGFKSPFGVSLEQLLNLIHMDNRQETVGRPGIIESSRMIMEDLGGVAGIVQKLKTSQETGILWTAQEKSDREQAFGKNFFPPPKIKTLWELILENFDDQINKILLGAAVVSIIIGEIQHPGLYGLLEGTSIMIALCIIITVSSGNNYASERRLADLVALADEQEVAVFRKGSSQETETISYTELVVGDLVKIEKGMKVPADCMLIWGQNVQCKEDALTGEPDDLDKTALHEKNWTKGGKNCIMYAKSTVANGIGAAMVLTVGENTISGGITKKAQEQGAEAEQTLLQQKLNRIAEQIGNVGYGCAIATFIAIVIRILCEFGGLLPCGCQNLFSCENPDRYESDTTSMVGGKEVKHAAGDVKCDVLAFGDPRNRVYTELLNTIIIAITVIVVAIPEGLPLAVTISLSFSSAKMQKENNLVRKLASAETMGAVTHICSDKTGTLTQNKMTTMACMCQQRSYRMASEDNPTKQLAQDVQAGVGDAWEILLQGVAWNSSARIEKVKEGQDGQEKGYTGVASEPYEYQGNVTEVGILKFFQGVAGFDGLLAVKAQLTEDRILCVVPFDSARKRGSIVVKMNDGRVRVYTKGAPDVLFGKDPEDVARLKIQLKQQDANLSDDKAEAVATKRAAGCMVKSAYTPQGIQGWQSPTSAENIQSLPEIMRMGGNNVPDHEDVFKACVKDYACQAYRTILICYRDLTMQQFLDMKKANNDFEKDEDRDVLEDDLVAVGLFGIQDPLRDTIVQSVQTCKAAGIKVIMCTGDNIDTATAISKNAGIVTDEDIAKHKEYSCMTGQQFRTTVGVIKKIYDPNDEEKDMSKRKKIDSVGDQGKFNKVIEHLRVLARSSPEDKYLLVTGLQQCPYDPEEDEEADNESGKPARQSQTNYCSVAVTGDGTNDAPALSKSNVGFAMGITGTDVAKGACDIILLDDNFASIVTALKYGRNIYDNVRKFLQFQLTVNVVAMFIVFFGSVILNDSPLNAVQMLWVNLIMDTFAALALATEPPDEDILERRPQPSSKAIVTELMWRNVYGHAVYQMAILIVVIFVAQGNFVDRYDLKCLRDLVDPIIIEGAAGKCFSVKDDPAALNKCKDKWQDKCPDGGLNPFYASKLYFETNLGDGLFWTQTMKDKTAETDFEPNAFWSYQCYNLREDYPASIFGKDKDGKAIACNKDNWKAAFMTVKQADLKFIMRMGKDGKTEEKVNNFSIVKTTQQRMYIPQMTFNRQGTQKLLHMTFVFQIFVFMQIFNQLNARLLTPGFNVFAGITKNWLFLAVTFTTFIIQMAMVEVGGKVSKTYPLKMYQNGICLAFGVGELFWGVFIKFLPMSCFQCFNFEEEPMTEEEQEKSTLGKLKKGSFRKNKFTDKEEMLNAVGGNLIDQIKSKQAQIEKKGH